MRTHRLFTGLIITLLLPVMLTGSAEPTWATSEPLNTLKADTISDSLVADPGGPRASHTQPEPGIPTQEPVDGARQPTTQSDGTRHPCPNTNPGCNLVGQTETDWSPAEGGVGTASTWVAQPPSPNHFAGADHGVAFAYPADWEVVADPTWGGEGETMLYSRKQGLILIGVLEGGLSPREWFVSHQGRFHPELITIVSEFDIAESPVLVIGQPDTSETTAMLWAIISHGGETRRVAYYATEMTADTTAFQMILETLSFANDRTTLAAGNTVPTISIPQQETPLTSDGYSPQATTADPVRARICEGAPMYIPTEGALLAPWGCFDKPVCKEYHPTAGHDYFRHPHRGIDISSGEAPGKTPIYAPYDGIALIYNDHTIRLLYEAPYKGIASYLTHMGNDVTGESFVRVGHGAKVYAGRTLLGYQGDRGSRGDVHLHISWHRLPGGETDFGNTLDPTPYLGARNLRFHPNWTRVAGPLTCLTTPIPPPAPPLTQFFNEELGASQLQADSIWWFSWYDASLGRQDVIHVANPGPNTATVDVYIAGRRRTSGASVAAGGAWHVRYDGLIAGPVKIVSRTGQPIFASKRTIWNEPRATATAASTSPAETESVGIGDASTVWWFPWYDSSRGRRNWVLVGNPGPNYAQVELRIAGRKTPDSPYVIPAGRVWTPNYADLIGGPVAVVSLNRQPVFVSQRVLWPDTRSFNEVQGMPQHLADTVWWAPWYDASRGRHNVIHVVNPGTSAATVDVYVAGTRRTRGATVPAGGAWHVRYEGVIGGPLRVVSTNGRPIIVSQRVIWTGHSSFDETMALPANQLDSTWWFPWYDSTRERDTVIHIANPGPNSARVEIHIDGKRMSNTPVTIPAGGTWHTRYPGLMGGPVRIVSTNGQVILSTQRVRWDGDGIFNEVKGVPQTLLALPPAEAPLSITTLAMSSPDGDTQTEVKGGEYLHLNLGAGNWFGEWQHSLWDWEVKDSDGNLVAAMSESELPLYIPTGLIGHRIGVHVPRSLPGGSYVLTGRVADAQRTASATKSVTFQVSAPSSEQRLYLPLLIRR